MDFSKFSDDNFDVKDWVNHALQPPKDTNVSVENYASNLVMKLQLFIQEVSKSLEETSQVALNNIPRVLREVENIKIETSLLKNQMSMVKDDIRKVEENTASSMKKLVEIDGVKCRMQDACNALQEADKWTILSSEADESFERGDLNQVAEKLIGMQKSLEVLKDVPDYNERSKVLQNHKNKLEALLSPTLVQIFNKHDLDDARHYVELFAQLDRLPQLQLYYNNCHKSSLFKTWRSVREDPNKPMTSWLPIFFDHLLALWHREISWCGQVFPDPIQALCVLMSQTLNSVKPSINDCIIETLRDGEDNLDTLIQLQNGTSRFVQGLEKAVCTFQGNLTTEKNAHLEQLLLVIRSAFTEYLLQYSQLQQTQLMTVIDAFSPESLELSDCAESLSDYIADAFKSADKALDSCLRFTNAYGSVGLIDAYKIFFSAFFGCINEVLHKLRKHHSLDVDSKQDGSQSLDDTTKQWSNFQYAFKMIEMCGLLLLKTQEFRQRVFDELNVCVEQIVHENGEQTPSNNYLKSHPTEWDKVVELQQMMLTYEMEAILPSINEHVKKLNEQSHHFAFDIIFIHFKRQLLTVPKMEIWCRSEKESVDGALPTFSLSPLPYITHIGDSLLTLPQQLEPFFVQDQNNNLLTALKVGQIPYQEQDGAHYDHQWLESFARGAMNVYAEAILKVTMVTPYATRQLIADIEYFFNILSALEIEPIGELQQIKQLLETDGEEFTSIAEKQSMDEGLVKTICKMRKIIL